MRGNFSNRLNILRRCFLDRLRAIRSGISEWGNKAYRDAAAKGMAARERFSGLIRDFRKNPAQPKFLAGVAAVALAVFALLYCLVRPGGAAGAFPAALASTVDGVALADASGNNRVELRRSDGNWVIDTLYQAPADSDRVARFLGGLLGPQNPIDAAAVPDATGLGPGEGIKVQLRDGEKIIAVMEIGLRPSGSYDRVYARMANGTGIFTLPVDLRGIMGLWRNTADAVPASRIWLKRRALALDPVKILILEASYPDHKLVLEKNGGGEWLAETFSPGERVNTQAVSSWLADLASFEIVDADDGASLFPGGMTAPTHVLVLTMDNGEKKTIAAIPNASGDGMWVELSDYPGKIFRLPAWRFKMYFHRMASLFPETAPSFSQDDVRAIDIRRGEESVKLIRRRNNAWRAVAQQYPLRDERVALLVRTLAGWRPEDFTHPGNGKISPVSEDPLLEIILDDGTVHHYRLGDKHPVFPWRYVLLDGATLFSTGEDTAEMLFPQFADILDMGTFFPTKIPPERPTENAKTNPITSIDAASMNIQAEPPKEATLSELVIDKWVVSNIQAGTPASGEMDVNASVTAPGDKIFGKDDVKSD